MKQVSEQSLADRNETTMERSLKMTMARVAIVAAVVAGLLSGGVQAATPDAVANAAGVSSVLEAAGPGEAAAISFKRHGWFGTKLRVYFNRSETKAIAKQRGSGNVYIKYVSRYYRKAAQRALDKGMCLFVDVVPSPVPPNFVVIGAAAHSSRCY